MKTAELTINAPVNRFSFSKIKLAKYDFVEYEAYATITRGDQQVQETSTTSVLKIAHADLLRCFQRLTVHFCLITESLNLADFGCEDTDQMMEMLESDEALECGQLAGFACRGLSWGKNSNGFTLSGRRWLKSGKCVNFNTPFVADEDEDYDYLGLLHSAIRELEKETSAYLNGKFAVSEPQVEQLGLFDEQPKESFLQGLVDNAEGFNSITISSSAGSVTVEKSTKAKRTHNGQTLDED